MVLQALSLLAFGAVAADGWTSLPLPSLCREPVPRLAIEPLTDGSHLRIPRRTVGGPPPSEPGSLPVANLLELMEADARLAGDPLLVRRPAPPLLVRGSDAALARAKDLVGELDRIGRAQEIELNLSLFAGVVANDEGAQGVPLVWQYQARTRSGGGIGVGDRREDAFLATFGVDVASGSGAADPIFGSAWTGETCHARAWRLDGGRTLFVEGLLDLSTLVEVELIDPGSPDLGRLQRPTLQAVQVRFAGAMENGGVLRVVVEGAPLAREDWTLLIRARTESHRAKGWRCVDLAWAGVDLSVLPLPTPGAGLAWNQHRRPSLRHEGLDAGALVGLVMTELGREGYDRRVQRPLAYSAGLFVGPAGDDALWNEVDPLVRAAEAPRRETFTLQVESAGTRVSLPAAAGVPVRVFVGRERTLLADYDTEIAQDSWMAAPRVESATDGWLVQGVVQGEELDCAWWSAMSEPGEELERGDTSHGRVELASRRLRADRGRVATGSAHELSPAGAGWEALSVRLAGP